MLCDIRSTNFNFDSFVSRNSGRDFAHVTQQCSPRPPLVHQPIPLVVLRAGYLNKSRERLVDFRRDSIISTESPCPQSFCCNRQVSHGRLAATHTHTHTVPHSPHTSTRARWPKSTHMRTCSLQDKKCMKRVHEKLRTITHILNQTHTHIRMLRVVSVSVFGIHASIAHACDFRRSRFPLLVCVMVVRTHPHTHGLCQWKHRACAPDFHRVLFVLTRSASAATPTLAGLCSEHSRTRTHASTRTVVESPRSYTPVVTVLVPSPPS